MKTTSWAFAAIGATLMGCTDPAPPEPAAVLTLFDIQAQINANATTLTPGNIEVRNRYTKSEGPPGFSLDVIAAFAQRAPAAYITTEMWLNVSKVWVQPLYVPARRDAQGKFVAIAPPVFSVGPDSAFYSPYWQVHFVVVPTGVTPDFRTSADVLDSGYPLVPGPGRLCSLSPAGVRLTPQPQPELEQTVEYRSGWVDGHEEPMDVVSLGDDRFTWNAAGVVDEDPLYIFLSEVSPGVWVNPGLPTIGGVRAPGIENQRPFNRPRFGSLWRLHFVTRPGKLTVMVPTDPTPKQADDHKVLEAAGVELEPVPASDELPVRPYYYRVILNPTCLSEHRNALPSAPAESRCIYLDSQAALRAHLPSGAITRSAMSATCPFVLYDGQPVPVKVP